MKIGIKEVRNVVCGLVVLIAVINYVVDSFHSRDLTQFYFDYVKPAQKHGFNVEAQETIKRDKKIVVITCNTRKELENAWAYIQLLDLSPDIEFQIWSDDEVYRKNLEVDEMKKIVK